MATVHEYFKTDFAVPLAFENRWAAISGGRELQFETRTLLSFDANAKYLAYYFPSESCNLNLMYAAIQNGSKILNNANNVAVGYAGFRDGLTFRIQNTGNNTARASAHMPGDLAEITDDEMVFTGRIFVYTEDQISLSNWEALSQSAKDKGWWLIYRGPQYAKERDRISRPRAFISHDSRDKEQIARPIATRLTEMYCRVWYDEFTLKVGDNLRESIEAGLKSCERCILVLTPNFLAKGGWPKTEYEAIFTREFVENRQLMLPIWAGVTRDEIFEYSPALANRVGLDWKLGEEEVCNRLFSVLVPGDPEL